ncbi:hypothetical protein BDQ17DRAFT_1347646 [Cyathus striatus]|nr:hypothetical protein BDQ17DRAFT_1347646 [Cyathus striatus]
MEHIHWLKHSPLSNYQQRSGTFSEPYLLWKALSHIFDCIIPLQELPKPSTDLSLHKGKGKDSESADYYTRSIVESMLVLEASLCAEIIHISTRSMIKAFVFTFELCRLFSQTTATSILAPEMMACLSSLFTLARSVLVLAAAKGCLGDIAGYEDGFHVQVPVMGVVLETIHLYEPEVVMLHDVIRTVGEVLRELEIELSVWEEWWSWTKVETEIQEFLEESQSLSAPHIVPVADGEYNWGKDWEMAVKYSNCFEFIRRIASTRHRDLVPILESVPHMPDSPLGSGISPPEVDVQPVRPSLKRRRIIKWSRPAGVEQTGFDRHGQSDLPGVPIRIKRNGRN